MRYPVAEPFDSGVLEAGSGHRVYWERAGSPRGKHASRIAHIPAVFVRGRLDIASPLGVAWRLAQQLPLATLHVVEDEDHAGAHTTDELLTKATNRFAE